MGIKEAMGKAGMDREGIVNNRGTARVGIKTREAMGNKATEIRAALVTKVAMVIKAVMGRDMETKEDMVNSRGTARLDINHQTNKATDKAATTKVVMDKAAIIREATATDDSDQYLLIKSIYTNKPSSIIITFKYFITKHERKINRPKITDPSQ